MDMEQMAIDDSRPPFDARCELMLDVTRRTLEGDPDLKLCEGLRLIEATHRAIARLAPDAVGHFEAEVLPGLRSALMERFGVAELPFGPVN
jgi:hypothetical protein